MKKRGFTLIEMLTTTAIMVIIFGLLTILFGRATTIHRTIRGGGDAENYGIYLLNTVLYGPGINWDEGLIGCRRTIHPELSEFAVRFNGLDPTVEIPASKKSGPYYYLGFQTAGGKNVLYRMAIANTTFAYSMYRDKGAPYDFDPAGVTANYFDLKPNWAKDRQLELLEGSGFYYYGKYLNELTAADTPYYVGVKLMLKNTTQNIQEAVTLYRCVRVRNIIKY